MKEKRIIARYSVLATIAVTVLLWALLASNLPGRSTLSVSPSVFAEHQRVNEESSGEASTDESLVTAGGAMPIKAPDDDDGDGLPNKWENRYRLDRFSAAGADGAMGDPDRDGLPNIDEYYNFTDPHNADTDLDGMPDLWEVEVGLDPTDSNGINGSNGDFDGDGLENGMERVMHMNPGVANPGFAIRQTPPAE